MVEQITSYEVYKNLIKEAPLWNNGFTPGMIKNTLSKRDYMHIFWKILYYFCMMKESFIKLLSEGN